MVADQHVDFLPAEHPWSFEEFAAIWSRMAAPIQRLSRDCALGLELKLLSSEDATETVSGVFDTVDTAFFCFSSFGSIWKTTLEILALIVTGGGETPCCERGKRLHVSRKTEKVNKFVSVLW